MSSSVIASLIAANQHVIISLGLPILLIGIIGNFLNIIVFLSLKTFRQSSCAFYLTIMSMVNIGQLLTGLLTRILMSGFQIDWTGMSLVYCKFRTFFFQFTSLVSLACFCLAIIDQYLATCTRPHWQQWSHIQTAYRWIILIFILLIFEQSPSLIFYEHIQSVVTKKILCTITNPSFIQYNVYFNYLILGNLLPFFITMFFGIMAYRNIQQMAYRTVPLVRRELDKQLTAMVLVQLIYNFIAIVPNFIVYMIGAYGNIQETIMKEQINLAYAITLCLYYSYFASPFYIYISVSERFRRQLIYVLFKLPCRQQRVHPDQPVV